MTSFGQYPLVYQLRQLGDGSFIPVGLAETSSLGSFSAVNIVVSSISAADYQGFEQNISFTGILAIETTGTGVELMDVETNPNIPVIRSLATPTTNFLSPSLAGDGTVNIGYGTSPLSYDHGGTNNSESPQQNGVAHWYFDGSQYILDTDAKFTFDKSNLSIPAAGKYQIDGNPITITDLDNVVAPTTANTFLQWNGTYYIFTSVTGTGGGGVSFPIPGGRIPVTDTTTNLNTYADLAYNSSTKVLSTYAINNVCDVCAIRIVEDGTPLSTKYQGKDDTLTTIASLNPGTNQFIYFINTNVAATATVSPCALELLKDSTFADMRTTLQLNTYYQPCNVFLTTLASQGNVDLEIGGQVQGELPIAYGGTNKSSFANNGAVIFYNDAVAGSFEENANFTFLSNTLKSPNVCATTVCATTFQEGGINLSTKYQGYDSFLTDLSTQDTVNLASQVCGTLPVTKGGTGFNSISNNQIVVGTGTNTIGTITTPTDGTYLKYNTAGGFSWSLIPTGTGPTLPSEPCAVVFMDATGTSLTANKGIRVINSASTLEVFSDTEAVNPGGINLYPAGSQQGHLRWNSAYSTLGIQGAGDTNISLGVDELMPVVNNTGATINKGQVCYVSGSSGGTFKGTISKLASNNTTAYIIGVALNNITNSSSGYLIKKGLIKNASLTNIQKSGESWTAGQFVYVSDESGKLTNVAPGAGVHAARIGIILDTVGGNASIGVVVDRGYDLNELHDVDATPTNDGETLVWNAANSSYVTGTINSITGTLTVAKGGTGKTSFTANQLIYGTNFAQDSNLYYSNNVLYASAASATTNVSAGGSTYGGNASIAGFVYATGDIATIAGTVFGANVCGTNLFQGTTNISQIYQPIGSYQPNNTRLHELTAVSIDGLLRFNGSNYVTQPTATYETTAYARGNYETTGYARSTYETTGYARTTYETTGYARNTYETTGYSRSTYETTGYSRNTFATTASLSNYETTGYSRSTFATTASLSNYETTGYARSNYETTGYSRVNFATTASLDNYTTTATFNTFKQGVTDSCGVVFANGGNLDTDSNFKFDIAAQQVRVTNVSSDTTYFKVGAVSKSVADTLAFYNKPTFAGLNDSNGSILYVTGSIYQDIGTKDTFTFDEANNRLKVTNISATNYNNLALSSQLSDVQITATPTNGYALKWNSSLSKWTPQQDQTGGGGSTPVGSEGSVQYNREGAFYGDSDLLYVTGTTTLKSPNLSATTYLNLPSGTATWNANKIQGIPVSITSDTIYDILLSLGSNSGYINSNLLTLAADSAAGWNAAKLQGTIINATPPSTNDTLVYNGTAWTPTAPIGGIGVGVSYAIGNNLI